MIKMIEKNGIINFLGLSNVSMYNLDVVDTIMKDLEEFIDESKYDEIRDIIKGHFKK